MEGKKLWPLSALYAEFVCGFWENFGKIWNDRSIGTGCEQGTEQEW